MTVSIPAVSVLMPAYNHASFVEAAVASVLGQSFVDFEFLIADDGSTDGTSEVLSRFDDPRIRIFSHKDNRGAAVVHNELLSLAKGKYIGLINSDDVWSPGKLETQIEFLERRRDIGACFGRVRFIDDAGKEIPKKTLPFGNVFDQHNRSSALWLRYFFEHGNCLAHPTVVARADVYAELGPYDIRLRQLPDFDMWVRLVKKYSISILETEMLSFRIIQGKNASSGTKENSVRTLNEHYFIAKYFFDGVSQDTFVDGFSDLMIHKSFSSTIEMDVEKVMVLLNENGVLNSAYTLVAVERMYQYLSIPEYRVVLQERYNFDSRAFHKLMGSYENIHGSGVASVRGIRSTALLNELRRRLLSHGRRFTRYKKS